MFFFCDKEHEHEFKRLRTKRIVAGTSHDTDDYALAYYLLTADSYLRKTLERFMGDHPPGEIHWGQMIESKDVREDYRQLVYFAHQLYSGGWKNEDLYILKLLDSLSDKPNLREAFFEVCRRYLDGTIMEN